MHKILELELLNVQKGMIEKINEIKATFMPTIRKPNKKAADFLADYEKEKQVLKKYNCKDSSEIIEFLVEIESAAMDLQFILFRNKQ